jgi:hypothetical protein
VSKSEKIAALETLLARVRSRAAEPRETRQPEAVVSHTVVAAPVATPSEPPASDEIDAVTIPPEAPPLQPAPAMRAALPTEADVVVEVDVLQEAAGAGGTVIGVAAEEAATGESPGSRERLVAAERAMGVVAEMPVPGSVRERPSDPVAVVEQVEEAPASSRRAVVPEPEERLSDMAFGAEETSSPLHTPPPESGRLPAAQTHVDQDADVTGVREAPPMASRAHDLIPEATRADLAALDAVADIVGEAQRFSPATFAGLLDASLAL